jgi:hypothetical protein
MSDADSFDLDAVRIDGDVLPPAMLTASTRPPRHKAREPFLAGPIPWRWIVHAGRLPGCALLVGIVLWREAKMKRNKSVRFCLSHLRELGKSVDTARRGLQALEAAKLVSVKHDPGKCVEVTILDPPAQ